MIGLCGHGFKACSWNGERTNWLKRMATRVYIRYIFFKHDQYKEERRSLTWGSLSWWSQMPAERKNEEWNDSSRWSLVRIICYYQAAATIWMRALFSPPPYFFFLSGHSSLHFSDDITSVINQSLHRAKEEKLRDVAKLTFWGCWLFKKTKMEL